MHAFVRSQTLPSVDDWQAALVGLALPFQLDPALDLATARGYVPCRVYGKDSGAEMFVDSVTDLVAAYPQIESLVRDARLVVSFRWGGDEMECACALAAAAGLITAGDALVYYPPDEMWYDLDGLRADFNALAPG
jgi:hypothetical protein